MDDEGHAGQLVAMRNVSAAQLVRHGLDKQATDCYEATIDCRRGAVSPVKPLSSLEALNSGIFNKVPVMLGYTEDDGEGKMELEQTIFPESDVRDMEGLLALLRREFGPA